VVGGNRAAGQSMGPSGRTTFDEHWARSRLGTRSSCHDSARANGRAVAAGRELPFKKIRRCSISSALHQAAEQKSAPSAAIGSAAGPSSWFVRKRRYFPPARAVVCYFSTVSGRDNGGVQSPTCGARGGAATRHLSWCIENAASRSGEGPASFKRSARPENCSINGPPARG